MQFIEEKSYSTQVRFEFLLHLGNTFSLFLSHFRMQIHNVYVARKERTQR